MSPRISEAIALNYLKAALGMTTTSRDEYLLKLLESVKAELTEEKGIELDDSNANHLMFVVDYAEWRYKYRDEPGGLPLHLKARMRDLYVHSGGAKCTNQKT